jgi:outer membrane lipoprotein-sorting protein
LNDQHKTNRLQQIAEQAISDDLDLWPSIQAQLHATTRPRLSPFGRTETGKRWPRRSLAGIAAAAALVLVIGATSPLWSRSQTATAQAILERAEATANDASLTVTTYHLLQSRRVPGKGNATISTEMWYGGKDRQRSNQVTRDDQGATISTQDVIFNGAQTWIASSENGQTRVIHTTGTTWTAPIDDPTRSTSLADVLSQYSNDKSCMAATSQGVATVANRPSYVIVLHPKPEGCAARPDGAATTKVATRSRPSAGQPASPENGVGQMTVWVDEQSFLPLATEVRNPAGVLLDRSEVTHIDYNVPIPDATFSYVPPAGATVSSFTGGSGADVKRALFGGPAPVVKPTPTP